MARDGRPRSPHGGVIISHTYTRSFSLIASTFVISCTISHSPSGDSSPLSRSHHVSAILGLTRGYDWNSPPTFGRQEFPFSFLFVMRPIQAFAQLFYDTTTVQHVSFFFFFSLFWSLGRVFSFSYLADSPSLWLATKKRKSWIGEVSSAPKIFYIHTSGGLSFLLFFLKQDTTTLPSDIGLLNSKCRFWM